MQASLEKMPDPTGKRQVGSGKSKGKWIKLSLLLLAKLPEGTDPQGQNHQTTTDHRGRFGGHDLLHGNVRKQRKGRHTAGRSISQKSQHIRGAVGGKCGRGLLPASETVIGIVHHRGFHKRSIAEFDIPSLARGTAEAVLLGTGKIVSHVVLVARRQSCDGLGDRFQLKSSVRGQNVPAVGSRDHITQTAVGRVVGVAGGVQTQVPILILLKNLW